MYSVSVQQINMYPMTSQLVKKPKMEHRLPKLRNEHQNYQKKEISITEFFYLNI